MEQSGGIQASLSGRYAIALFDLARDEGKLDAVGASLAAVRQAIADSEELRRLIDSPLVGRTQAEQAVAAIAGQLGVDHMTAGFLGVLARNRRLGALGQIIRDFTSLAARHRGETSAEVVSAHPLDDGQMASLRARLKSMTGTEVSVDARVDPAILGGLVVKLGSRQIDGSIRTRLNTLAQAMRG